MSDATAGKDTFNLHIDNDSSLGIVFEVTPERLEAAKERFPDVAERLHVTIDHDCKNFDRYIADADALLCWRFDLKDIARRAPRLRWIHASGAGVEYFAPFDWLPEGVTFINNRGVHAERASEYAIMGHSHVEQPRSRKWSPTSARRIGTKFSTQPLSARTLLVRRRRQRRRRCCALGEGVRPQRHRRAAFRRSAPRS